jgi:hypothetical protein
MKRSMDGSSRLLIFFSATLLTFGMATPCYAKSIHDILKPTKNTLNWLDRLDTLDSLENINTNNQSDQQNFQNSSRSAQSVHWIKEQAKTLRSFSQVELTNQFTVKPGKIKSRPLKLSDVSEYYEVENIGEQNEQSKTQRGYGLKFNYEFR